MKEHDGRRALTESEEKCTRNLKNIYESKKKSLGLTQEILADLLGWKSQGSVNSYLNGRIPLNTDAKIAFSKALEISITDIDPDFDLCRFITPKKCLDLLAQNILDSKQERLSYDENSILVKYRNLSSPDKRSVSDFIDFKLKNK